MQFDRFTMVLLVLRPDAPKLDDHAADALQDAHLAHLASLHEGGQLLAAGPLLGGADEAMRGLCLYRVPIEEARALAERDPAVVAGRFSVKALPWMVPSGAMTFAVTRFPHSMGEAQSERPS